MDALNTIKKFFYEAVKIVSKVFEIWKFGDDRFDYNYNTDFNGEGGLKDNFEAILDQLG